MYICYVDDSGTPDIQDIGNTNHFVLAGIAIPVEKWRDWDKEIFDIKKSYKLKDSEIHTAWLMRKYHEQNNIAQFEELDHSKRIESVENHRKNKLKIIQNADRQKYKRTKKNYQKTKDYIHLTYDERKNFLEDISKCVSNWTEARLFAECVDKRYNYPNG